MDPTFFGNDDWFNLLDVRLLIILNTSIIPLFKMDSSIFPVGCERLANGRLDRPEKAMDLALG